MAFTPIQPELLSTSFYKSEEQQLISGFTINNQFFPTDYIDLFIYNGNKTLINSIYDYKGYLLSPLYSQSPINNTTEITQIQLDPDRDLAATINNGNQSGNYYLYYNFLENEIGSNIVLCYLSEISSDRTEIRIKSNDLTPEDFITQAIDFTSKRENSEFFLDFYVNFQDNNLSIANNFQLEGGNSTDPSILIKLYQPLSNSFQVNTPLWVCTSIAQPQAYQVSIPSVPIPPLTIPSLQGPNFNLPIKDQVNNSSQNLSYNDLTAYTATSSLDQFNSLMSSSSLSISVDYTDFNDFIHFSTAQTRLENFSYKVGLLESYSSSIAELNSVTSSATSINILQNKISDVINNFDQYEYFLYYTSGSSQTWPKTTNLKPYELAKTDSSQALIWLGSTNEQSSNFGGMLLSASNYDNANKDQLLKAVPEYLRDDSSNKPYELFVDMVAQYYDNVWLYTKDITQKYNADNRLDYGVSKDLVADAIRDFGVKLYQNNFSQYDLYSAFLGNITESPYYPFSNITGSGAAFWDLAFWNFSNWNSTGSGASAPTGYEYLTELVLQPFTQMSMDDVNKSLYKRIYHNIPYLLKSKGTIAGLRALITSYGIPDTILRISEFGGKDKVNENDWDYYFNKFNYAFSTTGSNFISSSWETNSEFNYTYKVPGTVEFRFKTDGLPVDIDGGGDLYQANVSQSLWYTEENSVINKALVLEYTGSFLNSGSYSGSLINEPHSGSIKDPYYQYGNLKYIANPNTANEVSCSVYLPFFDGGWWSVMVREDGFETNVKYLSTEDYDFILTEDGDYVINDSSGLPTGLGTASLFAANKIYNGKDGTQIGYNASNTLIDPTTSGSWLSGSNSYFAKEALLSSTYQGFSGSLQEIRYYTVALGTTRFEDYTMNPLSIEGNSVNSSPNELLFRASLGSELDISDTLIGTSIHPKITGSWIATSSFASGSNYIFNDTASFLPNNEYYFLDQFPAGIKNRITDKIRYEDNVVPSGDTLSPFRRITQATEASASYTENINYLEVAFSPQNEINDDITSQLGYFNMGDYIGDPRQRSSSLQYYPDLNSLSEDYFEKYLKNYDLVDFVRLIKFFDNSLFKMIKDFIPARTSLASGIVIKQHLLERNKYPQPQVSREQLLLTGSIDIGSIEGGPGGMVNQFNSITTSPSGSLGLGPDNAFNITQSWDETFPCLSGSVIKTNDSQHEFFDGEYSGSTITVTTQSLSPFNLTYLNEDSYLTSHYSSSFYTYITTPLSSNFLTEKTTVSDGEILLYYS